MRVHQAQVLLNLGRQDKLDSDGLRRLVASINRYLGEPARFFDFTIPTAVKDQWAFSAHENDSRGSDRETDGRPTT